MLIIRTKIKTLKAPFQILTEMSFRILIFLSYRTSYTPRLLIFQTISLNVGNNFFFFRFMISYLWRVITERFSELRFITRYHSIIVMISPMLENHANTFYNFTVYNSLFFVMLENNRTLYRNFKLRILSF